MKKLLLWLLAAFALCTGILAIVLDVGDWEKLDIDKIRNADAASVMLSNDGAEACLLSGTRARLVVGAEDIPDIVKRAFVACEDARFYSHHGVDVKRIFGALAANIKSGSVREGASTITQQLIKLTHLTSDKQLKRKANEAYLALQLETRMSKDEILTAYMNTAYFGEGAYGIERAARAYFGKSTSDLTLADAALLAGLLKAPSSYSPFAQPEKARARRDYVLNRMAELGYIDEATLNETLKVPLPTKTTDATQRAQYGFYRDAVITEACEKLNISADELLTGGYTIYTCLDVELQKSADKLFEDGALFPPDADDGTRAQAAFCALGADDGGIRALIGGREYAVLRGLNRATQMTRQPGSAFKPISVYAAAVDARGMSPTSLLDDSPREFEGGYKPANAGGNHYGIVTMRQALAKSLNTASVALMEFTGVALAREYAMRAGVELMDEDKYLSLALGSLTQGVTPVELAGAYAPLANGGARKTAHTIDKILDKNGRVLYEFIQGDARVMTAESAYMITSMLTTAAETGSAKALSDAGIKIAGKTGTVGEKGGGNRDIWTVAYTGKLVACVWMGFDEPDERHSIPAWAGGASYPARMLAQFFRANANALSAEIKAPSGIVHARIDATALSEYGQVLLATDATPEKHVMTEPFREGGAPKYFSSLYAAPQTVTAIYADEDERGDARLKFVIPENDTDYLILLHTHTGSEIIGTVSGAQNDTHIYTTPFPDGVTRVSFSVIPRNRRLFESGVTLYGQESETVTAITEPSLMSRLAELFEID